MSMRDYAFNDYGLLMTKEMLKMVASKVIEDYTEEKYDDDPWSFNEDLYECGVVEYISEFIGEAICVRDDGTDDYRNSKTYDSDTVYYIPVSKISTLFKAAYNNIDEMIEEFKDRVGKYLPDDFNYRPYVCHIVGTYYA